ncbi:unnamed protein product [Caenorhabditis bovis]|uniref:Acyltransferase n=1 Tax=Caenorhabditis bovis TaxID=2654633 RepID=A0A8S1E6A5_9PELO|nr:unnamed protein product [Caenorhabditis bovis]
MRLRLNSRSQKPGLSESASLLSTIFRPINVPWKRWLETLAVMFFIFMWVILPIMMTWIPLYVLFVSRWWFLVPLYAAWFYYDFRTPRKGSRPWKWLRNHVVWRYFADYFPLRLVKTAELSPERNYIIGSHPHGMFSVGAYTSFCTNATGFEEKFPGITPTILTLNGQFYFPLRREFGMLVGGTESSKESLQYSLTTPGKGKACAIVVGGALEALEARPNNFTLVLKKRKGFCKYALMHGADLVPMYHFGENDLYEQYENPKGSRLRTIQEKILRVWGLCPPMLRGRSIFNQYLIGLMPFRRPVTSVMGKPIRVTKVENPSDEQINELHSKYCQALMKLFDDYKHLHSIPKDVHLTIE